jgi:hypothetical protein
MADMQSVITGATIPKDLAGIDGLEVGFHPPTENECRLLISGSPGSGKSTFLNSNPNLLMVDVERGGRTVADPRAMRFSIPVTTDPAQADKAYLDFVDKIIARKIKGATDIKMVGFDSADELITLFQRALCLRENCQDVGDVGGGHGKGYAVVREAIANMLDRLHQAGLGWAIVAHTTTKTVTLNKEEIQVASLAVSDTYKSMLLRKCEHFLFVESGVELITPPPTIKTVKGRNIETVHAPEPKPCRYLKTAPGGIWRGAEAAELKVRVPLPERIKLPQLGGFETFSKAYNEAVSKLMEKRDNV